jgi:hypothetical protein
MSRPPFTVQVASSVSVERPNGTPVGSSTTPTGFFATETTIGSSGHIVKGTWKPPKAYTLTYRSYRRAVGICNNTTNVNNLSLGQVYKGCVGAGAGGRFDSLIHFNACVLESALADSSLRDQALLRARLKMKRADVNLGVAFAERNATARLLGDTAFRMGKAFRHLKAGRVRAAMNELGISSSKREPRGSNVPNKWLEMQYGWKPLISDVYGACQALTRRDTEDWRVTSKAATHNTRMYTAMFTGTDYGAAEAQVDNGAFVRIDALPENDLTMSLRSLGITNPALILWELVPYSFVVDWCLPVGTWLESLDALLGYRNASHSATLFTTAKWKEWGLSTNLSPTSFIKNNYEGSKKVVLLDRDAGNGVPMPTFPRIKDGRSLGHMANGLALLASAFGRR